MKSKERVAKQGVAREGKVVERIKCVCVFFGGGGGEREKEKQECIFHSKPVIKDILKTKQAIFLFSLSLPHAAFFLFILISSFPFFFLHQ